MIGGKATFPLRASSLTGTEFPLTVVVFYDVSVGWDPISRAPFIEAVKPCVVDVYAGSVHLSEEPWKEIHGSLRSYIERETKQISSWEELDLTEEEAREALNEEAAEADFRRDHAAGAL